MVVAAPKMLTAGWLISHAGTRIICALYFSGTADPVVLGLLPDLTPCVCFCPCPFICVLLLLLRSVCPARAGFCDSGLLGGESSG